MYVELFVCLFNMGFDIKFVVYFESVAFVYGDV